MINRKSRFMRLLPVFLLPVMVLCADGCNERWKAYEEGYYKIAAKKDPNALKSQ
jgi:hypothetical protein